MNESRGRRHGAYRDIVFDAVLPDASAMLQKLEKGELVALGLPNTRIRRR